MVHYTIALLFLVLILSQMYKRRIQAIPTQTLHVL